MKNLAKAVADAYDDCIEVAKDFTGQGVHIRAIITEHKKRALGQLKDKGVKKEIPDAR